MEKSSKTPAVSTATMPDSTLATILNGLGNGAMIGGAPFVVPEVITKAFAPQHQFSQRYFQMTIASTGICALVGAFFSLKEAKQVNDYRAALARDIESLHQRLDKVETPASGR